MTGDNMNKIPLFYTYPPVQYDYVLRNIKQKPLPCKHEIVDIGVYELLKDPYSKTTLQKFVKLKTDGLKVVPDYPDIFKEHGIENMNIDNVLRSKLLMKKYYNPKDKTQMPVIQGYYNSPNSFVDYAEWFLDNYIVNTDVVIGVGTLCKNSDKKTMKAVLKNIREIFPNNKLHAFGLSIRYITELFEYLDSFDTTAWTFPRTPGLPSAKNKKMRIQYFHDYIDDYNKKKKIIENQLSLNKWQE